MKSLWLAFIMVFGLVGTALADVGVLSWQPVVATDLAGYKVYCGTESGTYNMPNMPVLVAKNLITVNITMPQLTVDQRYYCVCTAYDEAGNESKPSNEVSKLIVKALPANPPDIQFLLDGTVTGPWNVVVTSVKNLLAPYTVDWYVGTVFHHTDSLDPRCVWRQAGTNVCTGGLALKPIGTYRIEARVMKGGVEVTRKELVVIVPDSTAPPTPLSLLVN